MDSKDEKPQNIWGPMIAFATTLLYAEALRDPNKRRDSIFLALILVVYVLYAIGKRFKAIQMWKDEKVEGHYLAWLIAWVILLVAMALFPSCR